MANFRIEFRDVNAQPDCYVVRVAIEILEIYPSIEDAAFLVQLSLHTNLTALIVKDAGEVLDEPASLIELCHDCRFVHTRRRREVDIVGESRVGKIRFPETIAAFKNQYILEGCRGIDSEQKPAKHIIPLNIGNVNAEFQSFRFYFITGDHLQVTSSRR